MAYRNTLYGVLWWSFQACGIAGRVAYDITGHMAYRDHLTLLEYLIDSGEENESNHPKGRD
jgi:hypothetical protein